MLRIAAEAPSTKLDIKAPSLRSLRCPPLTSPATPPMRLLPAHAGMTRRRTKTNRYTMPLPAHAGMTRSEILNRIAVDAGPRIRRGWPERAVAVTVRRFPLPADAGMTRRLCRSRQATSTVPRTRRMTRSGRHDPNTATIVPYTRRDDTNARLLAIRQFRCARRRQFPHRCCRRCRRRFPG